MNKVKVVVDSTVDLSPAMYKENNIEVIPLNVNFGEENYKDGVTINQRELYEKVKKFGVLPHTAAPSPEDYVKVFKKYIDEGYDIVYMGIGSLFSTSLQNANIAKQEFDDDRIYLVDSLNLSSGSGLLAMRACRLAKEGKSAAEIKRDLDFLVPNISSKFAVDTLEYLHKGGRCSGASKLFGHIFHIHPIISVVEGKMIVTKKPRGLMKVAINEMIDELKNDLPNIYTEDVFVTSSGCSDDVREYFLSEVKKLVDPKSVHFTDAGCVVCSHCGYGTIGVLYIKNS